MSSTKVKKLSSLFQAAIKTSSPSPPSSSSSPSAAANDTAIKLIVSSTGTSHPSSTTSISSKTSKLKNSKSPSTDRWIGKVSQHISSVRSGDTENGGSSSDSQGTKKGKPPLPSLFHGPCFPEISNRSFSIQQKEFTREWNENYFLALCECNQTQELLQFLETVDVTKISSVQLAVIFKCLGKLSLESYAEKFIMSCKDGDFGAENISLFIFNYVMGLPNLVVDGLFTKIKDLHDKLEVAPSSISYNKLIMHCCHSQKAQVHVALNIIDQVFEAGSSLPLKTFHLILRAAERSCEFNLVRPIYSLILRHDLKPNNETFRMMITLSAKMKDFVGAYRMLEEVEKMNLIPGTNLYNAIMLGYFQEKNICGALNVLKQMELADVKPDSQTFSLLINNCKAEEDIIKVYEELKCSGVPVTKYIYMALINAYASCGQFDKAKQVVSEQGKEGIPLNNTLVSALASNGQISDALAVYEEMKESGYNLEPKAIIFLIEYLPSEGQLSTMLQLLKELKHPRYLLDGINRVILYCVQYKHLSSAIDLLKQLKDECSDDGLIMDAMCDQIFAQIAETKPVDVQNGLDLLQAIKEELELIPSRKSLDFLLSACVEAKDLDNLRFVWKEYEVNNLPYNSLSYLRMYQGLLASGEHKSAVNMLTKLPTEDPHVHFIITACRDIYPDPVSEKNKLTKIPTNDPREPIIIKMFGDVFAKSVSKKKKKTKKKRKYIK